MNKKNWAVFMSGWGRSVIKTLELYNENKLNGHDVSLIVYESRENGVAKQAADTGIPFVCIPKQEYDSDDEYYMEIINRLTNHNIDYIFLMGYKHIIREPLLSTYQNRIVNIHPSLLPSFRGKRAIQQALNYGVKITGITTHLIDEELDKGRIICQRCIRIKKGETFEELDQRFVAEGKNIIKDTFSEIDKYE